MVRMMRCDVCVKTTNRDGEMNLLVPQEHQSNVSVVYHRTTSQMLVARQEGAHGSEIRFGWRPQLRKESMALLKLGTLRKQDDCDGGFKEGMTRGV